MIDIDFHYDGSVIPFQSQKEEIMKNIINNFCRNESINISQDFFFIWRKNHWRKTTFEIFNKQRWQTAKKNEYFNFIKLRKKQK